MAETNTSEKIAMQKQIELLSDALEKAKVTGGLFLNQSGKKGPMIYPKGLAASPFNSLILALHSDANGYSTNQYTLFSETKKRGDSVLSGQKGAPFIWYSWNEYQNKANPEDKISKEEFKKLNSSEQQAYKPLREREVRTLFNIEQTSLPYTDKNAFEKIVKETGSSLERELTEKDDKQLRISFNELLSNIKRNMVSVRKDGTGVAHYDSVKDAVFIPAQKNYPTYADYAQEALRQIITATGHPQRLGRQGVTMDGMNSPTEEQKQRENLIVELSSAIKMNQLGLPSRISEDNLSEIDNWKQKLKDDPSFLIAIEADVNNTIRMIEKAENGVKIEMTPIIKSMESKPEDIKAKVTMLKDDNNQWALFIKPEGENGFAITPDKNDINRFFVSAKQGNEPLLERIKQEMAQKYYTLATDHPDLKIDLFLSPKEDIDLSKIQRVNIFKSKNEDGKIFILPFIEGVDKIKPREITASQWQRMGIADNKMEYKRNLAAHLFADLLLQKQEEKQKEETKKQEEDKRRNSPEQKERERKEEKAKEELTKAETKAVAAVALAPLLSQFNDLKRRHPDALLLFRMQDSYVTYKEDAKKISDILGIETSTNETYKENGKPIEITQFQNTRLDEFLPKLIRAGERVAICDQLEKQLDHTIKSEAKNEPSLENQEDNVRGFHR